MPESGFDLIREFGGSGAEVNRPSEVRGCESYVDETACRLVLGNGGIARVIVLTTYRRKEF